jgi:hypothetical protein
LITYKGRDLIEYSKEIADDVRGFQGSGSPIILLNVPAERLLRRRARDAWLTA